MDWEEIQEAARRHQYGEESRDRSALRGQAPKAMTWEQIQAEARRRRERDEERRRKEIARGVW